MIWIRSSSSLIYRALKPSLLKLSSFPHLGINQFHHRTTITCDVGAKKNIIVFPFNCWVQHVAVETMRIPALCTKPIKIIRQLKCWIIYFKCLNYSFWWVGTINTKHNFFLYPLFPYHGNMPVKYVTKVIYSDIWCMSM